VFAFAEPSTVPVAGTSAHDVVFSPLDSDNYESVTVSVDVTVNKADPIIGELPVASAVTFGVALGDVPLTGGAASVPGVFAFAEPSTVPVAGTSAHDVVFSPLDSDNYESVTVSVDVTVDLIEPPPLSPYEEWLARWGLEGADADPLADPGGDGIVNLLKYALALDPDAPFSGDGQEEEEEGGGLPRVEAAPGSLSLVYRRNVSASDLEFIVESSIGPASSGFAWVPAAVVETVVSESAEVKVIRATVDIAGAPAGFLRLRVAPISP
jgi:hypothetical protein